MLPREGEVIAVLRSENLGNAEVRDLQAASRIEKDILGFDIPVKDSLIVSRFQSSTHFLHESESLCRGETPGLHGLAEIDSIDIFHHQIVKGAGCAEVENRDNVGMIQTSEHPGFPMKSLLEGWIVAGVEYLQGDRAVEFRLPGLVDNTHATRPDHFENLKIGEMSRQILH